jgi:hypothetical protein
MTKESDPPREITRADAWDRFIDVLDRAGQAGQIASVVLPPLGINLPAGVEFGQLTRADVENLSRLASSLGRRGDVVKTMWDDLHRRKRASKKAESKRPG